MNATPHDPGPGNDAGAAPGPGGHAPAVPVGELSYTEASQELDAIVRFFEQRDVDVDQLVGRLVRATALVEELDTRLRQTRTQVEQLVPRLTAVLSDAAPASPGDRDAGAGGAGVAAARDRQEMDEEDEGVAGEDERGRFAGEDDEGFADDDFVGDDFMGDDNPVPLGGDEAEGGATGSGGARGAADDEGSTPELF